MKDLKKKLCLNSSNNINNLCLTTTDNACGKCSETSLEKIVEIFNL